MSKPDLPSAVQHLIWHHLRSIDHVAVLLAVRASSGCDVNSASARAMVAPAVAADILDELKQRGLITLTAKGYEFNPDDTFADAVALLAEMYNTKPVTLVRAIYDRPVHVIQQFADAFKMRRDEDRK